MNTTRLLTGFIGLLLAGTLMSCEDHRSQVVTPGANRLRVKRIEQQVTTASPPVTTLMDFAYDGQNRLSSILAYRTPDSTAFPVEQTLYQYDAQNRLTGVRRSEIRRGSRTDGYGLEYNASGQLQRLIASSAIYISPRYDAGNQLTGYFKDIGVGGLTSTGSGSFTFTSGNLTAASESFAVYRSGQGGGAPPVYARGFQATYTYDATGINPFYGTFIIPAPGVFLFDPGSSASLGPIYTLYGGLDNFFNLSRNNVETVSGTGITETRYSYTYNAAGLPTSRTTTTAGNVTEVLRFEYESY
jgi:hypothetical protein